jgi:predicted secreted protein
MGWALGIAFYLVIWWTLFFAVLPWGVKTQHEAGEVVPGSERGAPAVPHLWWKVLANTVLSAVVWLICDLIYIYWPR